MDDDLVTAWRNNADAWISLLESDGIPSRQLVTNAAMLSAVNQGNPRSILDVGCGEGWLLRSVSVPDVRCVGIDVVPALIARAEQARVGSERFIAMSLEEASIRTLKERFDAIVCNFSLLGKETVEQFLSGVSELLTDEGKLLIQTVHPACFCADTTYIDGWLSEDWSSFDVPFPEHSPWYFRTIQSWYELITACKLQVISLQEPRHPEAHMPSSLIIVAGIR